MVARIIFNKDGVKVSRQGFDAETATDDNLLMHPNMNPMLPVFSGQAVFTGNGTQTFTFTNPSPSDIINILLRSSDGRLPHPNSTYYATTQAPFNSMRIHNVDGRARTIQFRALS